MSEEVVEAIRLVRGNSTIRVWTGEETLHVSTDSRGVTQRFRVDFPDRERRGEYIDGLSLRFLLNKHDFKVVR